MDTPRRVEKAEARLEMTASGRRMVSVIMSRHCSGSVVVKSVAVGLISAAAEMWSSEVVGLPGISVGRARPDGWICVAPVAAVAWVARLREGWKLSVWRGFGGADFLKSSVRFG